MGDSSFARCLQGGGVNVQGGTVAISSCAISGNTAATNGGGVYVGSGTVTITSSSIYANTARYGGGVYVSNSGTVTITSSSIHGNTAFNYEVRAAETLKISHRPHGRLTCCLLFAGRRCLRLLQHGHDNVFLDLREYSFLCACSCSKFPIA
ncbi:hypothetical protein Ctob_016024, partial [Chrysochromulina tobinii]